MMDTAIRTNGASLCRTWLWLVLALLVAPLQTLQAQTAGQEKELGRAITNFLTYLISIPSIGPF